MQLREYQKLAIKGLWSCWKQNPKSKPLIIAPTGSGKSLIIADICRTVAEKRPEYKILVLAHRKELISQNAKEIADLTGMQVGIYSASLGQRSFKKITVAQVQSIYKKQVEADLIIIDESHLFSGKDDSMYGKLLSKLPHAKVMGLTATPYRLDQGGLIGTGGFFTDIAYNISVVELIEKTFLAPLINKQTNTVDMTGVSRSGYDYNQKQMEDKFAPLILEHCNVIREIDRKHILIFASGIKHAKEIAECLGESATYVTGEMLDFERDRRIAEFKQGRFKFLVNCEILTTGFNFPAIDCIVLLRATKSTSLYVQIVGRGMRCAEGKYDCLVLDFGNNIKTHGPIDCIEIKRKADGELKIGLAPTKTCPKCGCIWGFRKAICECSYEFPPPPSPLEDKPSDAPILSQVEELEVTNYSVKIHNKKDGGKDSLKIEMRCGQRWVLDFLCFDHGFYPANIARQKWKQYAKTEPPKTVAEAYDRAFEIKNICKIKLKKDGKWDRVLSVEHGIEKEFNLEDNPYNL